MALLGAFIHGILLWSIVYYLPVYSEGVVQHTPLRAVVDSLPLAFTVTPMSIVCALLIERSKRYLWTVWLGWFLSTAGFGTFVFLSYGTPPRIYNGLQVATGIGLGFLFPALSIPLQAAATTDGAGVATGTFVFFRSLGSALGVSLCATIFSNKFQEYLPGLNLSPTLGLKDASEAIDFIPILRDLILPTEVEVSILKVYAASIKYLWVTLASLSAVGFLSGFLMKELSLEKEELGRQAFQHQDKSADQL